MCPVNVSLMGAYQWCSHLANASEVALATTSSHFQWLYAN